MKRSHSRQLNAPKVGWVIFRCLTHRLVERTPPLIEGLAVVIDTGESAPAAGEFRRLGDEVTLDSVFFCAYGPGHEVPPPACSLSFFKKRSGAYSVLTLNKRQSHGGVTGPQPIDGSTQLADGFHRCSTCSPSLLSLPPLLLPRRAARRLSKAVREERRSVSGTQGPPGGRPFSRAATAGEGSKP